MKKAILGWCVMLIAGASFLSAEAKNNFNPFYFSSRADSGTAADCSYMNTPITEKQRISVGKDGHLYADGKRIRIFGTNVSAFPPVEDAEYWAKTLASQGINCIRFHHTDSDWAECFFKHDSSWRHIEFDEKSFERFDKFFYELKKAGIYSNINLLTGRTIRPDSKNGLPAELEKVADWKDRHCYGFWNENAKKEQQVYAEKILNHKNPYTGLTYAQDPAVAFVEINNENSMTKGFLDNVLDRYPKTLSQELDVLWTDFLLEKGLNYNTLAQKYNQSQSSGENLLSGVTTLEQHSGAKADLTENDGYTKISIKTNGKENWHIQYDYFGFQTEDEQMYTISFKAKASKETTVSVAVMMNHDPWQNLGFDKSIKLTKQWQEFSFAVATLQEDTKPRLTFGNMGQSAGTIIEFSDVTVSKGGDVICIEKSSSGKNDAVKFPSLDTYRAYPVELKQLVAEFLVKLDSDYWGSMNDYLKETLGIKALTFGSALPCAPITVMSKFDVVDSHAYWNHPSFPGSDWDTRNYNIKNASLINAKDGGTLANLAKLRVYGKPFSVTEYDHPYPNQYSSEMMPMYAVMASLQDWDCIYTFCYELSQRNPDKQKITGYFDQASNPAKIAAMPFAARIFREFKIKPFEKAMYYVVTPDTEANVIAKMGSAWNNVPPEGFGANQKASLRAKLGCFVTDNQNFNAQDKDFIKVDNRKYIKFDASEGFDNGGLYWDATRGYFVFNNENVYVSITRPGAKPELELLPKAFAFVPADDFAVLAGVKTDEAKWFIFSCCWSGNKGEKLFEYGKSQKSVPENSIIRGDVYLTTPYAGSGSVAVALGSTGSLEFENKKWKLYPLQQNGSRGSAKKKPELSPNDKTLWYELEK